MITHDGSGTAAGTTIYFNGVSQFVDVATDTLNDTIVDTAAPVRIGGGFQAGMADGGTYFEGEMGFIEVWDEVKDAQYAIDRYNGGNPVRAASVPQLPDPELVLHLDACSPGATPSATWEDLTTNANHFTNMGATLDPVQFAFNFGGLDQRLVGVEGAEPIHQII